MRFLCLLLTFFTFHWLAAQDNYEIQVYGAETMPRGTTMFELHSNFTALGFRQSADGVSPDDKAIHETVEITHGFTSWFEVGAYLFVNANKPGYSPAYVGDHIRPRFRAPDAWHWPVGVSLSLEVGYQRRRYSNDTWTLEIRPIIDKQYKWFYVAFNPVIDYAFVGESHHAGLSFSPDVKVQFNVTKKVGIGLEYYGGLGAFSAFDRPAGQFHELGLAFDLDVHPDWEINFGYMVGLTPATERGIFKVILGRRVHWRTKKKSVSSSLVSL